MVGTIGMVGTEFYNLFFVPTELTVPTEEQDKYQSEILAIFFKCQVASCAPPSKARQKTPRPKPKYGGDRIALPPPFLFLQY